jgi:catechol 2,3-dioxygenase-like lactoylglutathione lyase family enzyme
LTARRSTNWNVVCSLIGTREEELVKTSLGHLVFHIDPKNAGFYKELFDFLGWKSIYDDGGVFGITNGGDSALWFEGEANDAQNDHDGAGLNHLAINSENQADVDTAAAYLRGKGVELLYGTPCNRPEHADSENHLYYSAMFESPDRILLEVVYTGPK